MSPGRFFDPARGEEIVARLENSARRVCTDHAGNRMTWRCWGAGDPLVLLHGQSGSWMHWVRNIQDLAADREVWCPDLPGMGDSELPPFPGDVVGVAEATLKGLRAIPGLSGGFDLVGFSFGGIVGALAADAGRLPVRHCVVVGSTALGLTLGELCLRPWRAETDASRRQELHRENLGILMLTPRGAEDPHALVLYTRDLERDRYRGRAIGSTTLLLDALGRTPARIGGIWGARDALVESRPERAQSALRSVRPDVRFAVIPDAGHWVAYEQPALFNAALRVMLAD